MTDVHPDPFYKTYSSTEKGEACHRGSGLAGLYGAETSSCDSPISLVNETFRWIGEHIKDDVDFVIWTGDSARHDNDDKIPRSEQQILEQNRLLVSKFVEVFGKPDNANDTDPTNDFVIPIVPTYGNNDILPHNIFEKGPNRWTTEYLDVWRQFIPEEQRHQFQRGGWFSVEVIPNKLAVFSLNTMYDQHDYQGICRARVAKPRCRYFFDSNSATDGCAAKSDPGYEHFDWLRIQLQFLRERGMKAILMGHVPPARTQSKRNWDETCWQKYTLWMRQYRDVVVGSLFGHMNLDHFMLHDFHDIRRRVSDGNMAASDAAATGDEEFSIAAASDYLTDLRNEWAKLPKAPNSLRGAVEDAEDSAEGVSSVWDSVTRMVGRKGKRPNKDRKRQYLDKIGGPYGERYSLSLVSPSVVPNYFPTLRIFEYNITGLEHHSVSLPATVPTSTVADQSFLQASEDSMEESDTTEAKSLLKRKRKRHGKSKKPRKPRKSRKYRFTVPSPPSDTSPPGPAYSPQTLTFLGYTQYFANLTRINNDLHAEMGRKPHPNPFKYELEYDTLNDTTYRLEDLTVRSYIDLAGRIGRSKKAGSDQTVAGDVQRLMLDDCEGVADQPRDPAESTEDDGMQDERSRIGTDKKKGHKKRKGDNKAWFTFVKRAFVGTMDLDDIRDEFGVLDTDDDQTDGIPVSMEL